jgi:hypothetical protein
VPHLRRAASAAAALALFAASPAVAAGDPVVSPSSGHELATWFKTLVELPAADNPVFGSGQDPCVRLADPRALLVEISFGDPVTCTAELGTVAVTGFGHFCSTFDPPDSPFYAVTRADQRECARRVSPETAMKVRVDDGPWVDLFQPQFETFTPQTTVHLPADNAFGVPAQTATITGYGWQANIRNLDVGAHRYVTAVQVGGDWIAFEHRIHITARR